MESLPVEVYSAAQVRTMDRHAIDVAGIPGYELMQRAGRAAFESLARNFPRARRVTVLCGAGNNAGDGYVLARLARAAGLDASVCALVNPARLGGEAAEAHSEFTRAGLRTVEFSAAGLAACEVVVDALLGTGIDRPVTGALRDCIAAANDCGRPILALDLPSGLDADTGLAQGIAIRATRTICFAGLKSGLFLGDGRECRGALEFAGLQLPASAGAGALPVLCRMDQRLLDIALPPRRRSAHKGDAGCVLVVGGHAMAGAVCLAGEAALRAGAGLVTVATAAAQAATVIAARPELIVRVAEDAAAFAEAAKGIDTVAIGPGIGLDARAEQLFDAAADMARPLVVDADALTLLARRSRRNENWILTPHAGEAARLLGSDAAAIERDRLGAARGIVARYGGVCVLKGADTLVAAEGAVPFVCDRGNPAMATAGAGDVLTGIIAALLASGVDARPAAAGGVLLHAMAGDAAAGAGTRGVIAGDLIAALAEAVNPPWN